jgi:hypothetical protein
MIMMMEKFVEWLIGRGNRSTRRKPAPVPICPPQTPHAARMRTRAAALGSQRLTAWAMARPFWKCSVRISAGTLEVFNVFSPQSLQANFESVLRLHYDRFFSNPSFLHHPSMRVFIVCLQAAYSRDICLAVLSLKTSVRIAESLRL